LIFYLYSDKCLAFTTSYNKPKRYLIVYLLPLSFIPVAVL
jgi:hypothetical protein